MTENASDHSEAVQRYIDIELESTFEFEERLSPDEDDSLFDSEWTELDESG